MSLCGLSDDCSQNVDWVLNVLSFSDNYSQVWSFSCDCSQYEVWVINVLDMNFEG